MINYKKLTVALICGTILTFPIAGCGLTAQTTENTAATTQQGITLTSSQSVADTSGLTLEFDEEDTVTSYDSTTASYVTLSQNGSTVKGSGVTADGSTVTITQAGTYVLSGTFSDGSIVINTEDKATVRIILNGVDISSSTTAPFIVQSAKKVIVTLADNTVNKFTDSARSTTESEDYSAAFYSKADLVLNGSGTLNINAGYRNGIKSTDDLKVVSGTYQITAAEDGVIGKDLLGIADGNFTIKSGTDGMKSTDDKDTTKGNIIIAGGTFKIEAASDGIQAENILDIQNGTFDITTGNGSAAVEMKSGDSGAMGGMGTMGVPGQNGSAGTSASSASISSDTDSVSMKALKASNAIYICGGTITLDTEDDGIHSNDSITIESGNISIRSGDDGVHADSSLTVNGGAITVGYCYEGLEAKDIVINNGDITISAEDDGINASDGSSTMQTGGFGMGGQNQSSSNSSALTINGGNLYVEADGDGLDSNGSITVNGGTTIVCGPTSSGDTAVDFDGECVLNGGTLMAFGSNGMVETPTSASNGSCIVAGFTSQQANTAFSITDSNGSTVLSYTPEKAYAAAVCYSSDLKSGQTYTVTAGSTSQSVTVNSSVTTSGISSMGGGAQGGGKMGSGQPGGMQSGNGTGGDASGNAGGGMSLPVGTTVGQGYAPQMPD